MTYNDGVVFEVKPGLSPNLIAYRKKIFRKYDLLRSSMFSLTKFIDSLFKPLSFTECSEHPPSSVFRSFNLDEVASVPMSCQLKKPTIRLSETPEPQTSFRDHPVLLNPPGQTLSVEHIDLIRPRRKSQERLGKSNIRYEELVLRTSRIRSRNISRKSHL